MFSSLAFPMTQNTGRRSEQRDHSFLLYFGLFQSSIVDVTFTPGQPQHLAVNWVCQQTVVAVPFLPSLCSHLPAPHDGITCAEYYPQPRLYQKLPGCHRDITEVFPYNHWGSTALFSRVNPVISTTQTKLRAQSELSMNDREREKSASRGLVKCTE